ncbi:hypothetical protein RI054_18g82420 [Pseudoscourfieldia marina]
MSLCSLASHFQVHAAKGTNEDGSGTLSYQAAALSFVYLWAALSLLAIPLILAMSAAAFRFYYWRPTQTLACGALSTLCPAAALHLSAQGKLKAYCGVSEHGMLAEFVSAALVLVACDFFEWGYHRMGHTLAPLWSRHRHHHTFSIPSPFAVIADDYLDQCVRAAPMLVLPAHQHTLHYTRA